MPRLAGFHLGAVLVAEQVQQPVHERRPPLLADELRAEDDVDTSTIASIAVFTISAKSTNAITISSAISCTLSTPIATAAPSTATATTKWMRRFRCVRRTWTMPSIA